MVQLSDEIRDDMERAAADLIAKNPDAKAEDLVTIHGFTRDQVAAYGVQAIRKSLALLCRAPGHRLISHNDERARTDPTELATSALVQAVLQVARVYGVPAALAGALNAFVTVNCALKVPRERPENHLRECLANLEACYRAYEFANTPAANDKRRPS